MPSRRAEPVVVPSRDLDALAKMHGGAVPAVWGLGDRPAVLVIDMVRAFVEDRYPTGWEETGRPCAERIAQLLAGVRPADVPVVYTTVQRAQVEAEVGAWLRGRPGPTTFPWNGPAECFEIVDGLRPGPDDIVIEKAKPSAFFGTQLVSVLTSLKVDSLVVTGMTTSGCVRATVVDAFSYNYRVVVPRECVADRSQISHEVSLLDIAAKYGDVVASDEVLRMVGVARR